MDTACIINNKPEQLDMWFRVNNRVNRLMSICFGIANKKQRSLTIDITLNGTNVVQVLHKKSLV